MSAQLLVLFSRKLSLDITTTVDKINVSARLLSCFFAFWKFSAGGTTTIKIKINSSAILFSSFFSPPRNSRHPPQTQQK